ncbi:hypothetical protein CEXT_560271 [Caerostris extrusa]|uniref:Uncharacterized protein n=1 Tax=Caerostris extrusa TaxID=172846 RepID=A0AAV4MJP7_CAEEX|nr:hypothetical protein CEXT_560271 [Caerostris extrusa]
MFSIYHQSQTGHGAIIAHQYKYFNIDPNCEYEHTLEDRTHIMYHWMIYCEFISNSRDLHNHGNKLGDVMAMKIRRLAGHKNKDAQLKTMLLMALRTMLSIAPETMNSNRNSDD